VVRAPWDGSQILAWAVSAYPEAGNEADSDYTTFRLVLADLFWTYGIEHPDLFESANQIVVSGKDLASKRQLGMRERDIERRSKILDSLIAKWQERNPRPRPRQIRRQPEPFVLEAGDCLVYPTSSGRLRNPYVGPSIEEKFYAMHGWEQDGWGAAMIVRVYRKYEVFARYVAAILDWQQSGKPTFSDFPALSILHTSNFQLSDRRRAFPFTTSRVHLKRMQIEVVGRLRLIAKKAENDFSLGKLAFHGDDVSFAEHARSALSTRALSDDAVSHYLQA
jgi:hypothetical protein